MIHYPCGTIAIAQLINYSITRFLHCLPVCQDDLLLLHTPNWGLSPTRCSDPTAPTHSLTQNLFSKLVEVVMLHDTVHCTVHGLLLISALYGA